MGYILLSFFIFIIIYLILNRKWGYLACFLLLYYRLLNTIMFKYTPGLYTQHTAILLFFYLLFLSFYFFRQEEKEYTMWKYVQSPVVFSVLVMGFVIYFQDQFSLYYDDFTSKMKEFELSYYLNVFFPFMAIPFYVISKRERYELVDAILFWGVAYILVLVTIFNFDSQLFQDRELLEDQSEGLLNTITLSRCVGPVVILSFFIILISEKKWQIIIGYIFFGIAFAALIMAGQRGTIIGAVLALFILVIRKHWESTNFIARLSPIIVIAILFLIIVPSTIGERFEDLENYQRYERFHDYINVWNIFSDNNFFYGLGSRGYYFVTGRSYPHNIVLEHIANYGLLGLILISILLILCVKYVIYIVRNAENYRDICIASCWILEACSAFVSSGINGQKMFYLFSGLLVIAYYDVRQENEQLEIKEKEDGGESK